MAGAADVTHTGALAPVLVKIVREDVSAYERPITSIGDVSTQGRRSAAALSSCAIAFVHAASGIGSETKADVSRSFLRGSIEIVMDVMSRLVLFIENSNC